MADAQNKQPYLLALLSVIPGVGHMYFGHFRKGFSLLLVFFALTLTFFLTSSLLLRLLMVFALSTLIIPTMVDVFLLAKNENESRVFSKPYVIFLLLVTGFAAFPLLFESRHFSRTEKKLWTGAVTVLALLFFTLLASFWSDLEGLTQSVFETILHGEV